MVVTLVTGGARSGKSAFAERYVERFAEEGVYVAAAQPFDDEMERRIARHRSRREETGFVWRTVEEPLRLPELVESLDFEYNVYRSGHTAVLVDCLTIWLSNLLLQWEAEPDAEERCMARVDELVQALRRFQGTIVLVTNEVGLGVVPATPLGRTFRDAAGRMNQRIAAAAERVFLVTAGIPIELKSREYLL
ncbi:bifunctional adenosylcobinamide kinase/adenosylcobinamide-phosphate guanylyltransferase [Paenibacillus sp.]|uniref:bifunctional adenosylcobinamide kinase/adenosylcobinamide-phosphate guanylyltransferase n=1 Tax=Paenibacillus sp. TaxID=58172 RepID=UPI002D4D2224|nr:bifunctional adenosylcobinamide kinase/adenosylcobinamide-phosphate guanylyltransferase [Paenibacillus sp.]HZG55214.1 bifunctional adenosylcobinamide kinase/adenosylcobinamide-phosphate guanylyltransferase [Paenibacillus sp.]